MDFAALQETLSRWASIELFGNNLIQLSAAAAVFILAYAVGLVVRRVLIGRFERLAAKANGDSLKVAAAVAAGTSRWFVFAAALFAASRPLTLDTGKVAFFEQLIVIAVLLQLGLWVGAAARCALERKRDREMTSNPGVVAAMDLLKFVVRVAIWAIVLLLVLSNLGVDITALVAGLGVGGIAVALAAQNILGDLFASLSIVLDKPFVVGDFLIIDSYLGKVEKVGIKTTRLRSLSGEQLVFSNNDLLSSRVRNYGRLYERRIVFAIGVTYQTPAEALKRIPAMIREAVEAESDTRFDRAHFAAYGDFSLNFETVYFVTVPDYNRYMDIQQAINLTLYERFEREGIEFAYPTQTVFVARESADAVPA